MDHFLPASLAVPLDLEILEKGLEDDLKRLSKLDENDRNVVLSRACKRVLDLVLISLWRGDRFKEKSQELILKMFSQITDDKLKCELLLNTLEELSSYDRYFIELVVKSASHIKDSSQRGSLLQNVARKTNNADDLRLCVDALCSLNAEDSKFFRDLARFSIDQLRGTGNTRFGEIAVTCIQNLPDRNEQAELYRALFRVSYDYFGTKFYYEQGALLRALVLDAVRSPELKLKVLAEGVLGITKIGSISDEDTEKALQKEASKHLNQACEILGNSELSFNARSLFIQEVVPGLLRSISSKESSRLIYPFLDDLFLQIKACDEGRTQADTPSFLESAFSDAINTINTFVGDGFGSYSYRVRALASIAEKLGLNSLMASQLISFLPTVGDSFACLISPVIRDLVPGVDSSLRQQLVDRLFLECLNRGLYRQALLSAVFCENVDWVRNQLLDRMGQIVEQPSTARAAREVYDLLNALVASTGLPRNTLSDVLSPGIEFLLSKKAYEEIRKIVDTELTYKSAGTPIAVSQVITSLIAQGELDLASAFLFSLDHRYFHGRLRFEIKELFAQELMSAYFMRGRLPWGHLWQSLRVDRKDRYIRRERPTNLSVDAVGRSFGSELERLCQALDDLKKLDSDEEKRVGLFGLLSVFEQLQDTLIFSIKTSADRDNLSSSERGIRASKIEDDTEKISEYLKNLLEARQKILDVARQLNFKLPILLEVTNIQLSTYSALVHDPDFRIIANVLQPHFLRSLDDFENLEEFVTDDLSEFWKKVIFLQILDYCYFGQRSRDLHYESLAYRLTNLRRKLGYEFSDLEVI